VSESTRSAQGTPQSWRSEDTKLDAGVSEDDLDVEEEVYRGEGKLECVVGLDNVDEGSPMNNGRESRAQLNGSESSTPVRGGDSNAGGSGWRRRTLSRSKRLTRSFQSCLGRRGGRGSEESSLDEGEEGEEEVVIMVISPTGEIETDEGVEYDDGGRDGRRKSEDGAEECDGELTLR
jgi:hypothetical protein